MTEPDILLLEEPTPLESDPLLELLASAASRYEFPLDTDDEA
jgi:hypothetical protein